MNRIAIAFVTMTTAMCFMRSLPPHPLFNALEEGSPHLIKIIASKMSREKLNTAYPTDDIDTGEDVSSSTTLHNTVTPLLFALTRAHRVPDDLLECVRRLLIAGADPNTPAQFNGHAIHPFEYVITTLPHAFNIIRPTLVQLFLEHDGTPTPACWNRVNCLRLPYSNLCDLRQESLHPLTVNEECRYFLDNGTHTPQAIRPHERTYIEHENLFTALQILNIFLKRTCTPPDNFLYCFFHNMCAAGSTYDQCIFAPIERYVAYDTLHESAENALHTLISRYPHLLEYQISSHDKLHTPFDEEHYSGTLNRATTSIGYSPCTGDTALLTLIRRLPLLANELSENVNPYRSETILRVIQRYINTLVSCGANPHHTNMYEVSAVKTVSDMSACHTLGEDADYAALITTLRPKKNRISWRNVTASLRSHSQRSTKTLRTTTERVKEKLRLPRRSDSTLSRK